MHLFYFMTHTYIFVTFLFGTGNRGGKKKSCKAPLQGSKRCWWITSQMGSLLLFFGHFKTSKYYIIGANLSSSFFLPLCSLFLSSLFPQVATWVDETLSSVASKLEHTAQTYSELQGERIVSLHCCALYTCAQLENNLYWW